MNMMSRTPRGELDMFCASADFVFNLAGVNRPKDQTEFMEGNFGFASELLDALEGHEHRCGFDGVTTVFEEQGAYCAAPVSHHVTLGEIVELL